jgi:hypothetical protein
MNCAPLPSTGLDANLGLLLLLATACLTAGTITLLMARRSGRGAATALMLLLVVGTVSTITAGVASQAATSGCSSAADNSLTVTQTSTLEGLAPGIAPVPITGRVVNNATDSTYITAVDVEITSLTPGPGSPAGTCGASDYHVLDTRMPVGRTLGPGGSTSFAGASIVFSDKTSNQDACQDAIVHLLYTANPN